jgi:hypothetical protein
MVRLHKKGSEKELANAKEKIFDFNKKGSEKLLSIWWFFVLVIVLVAIVTGVLIFYSVDLDLKSYEAKYLSEKLMKCFSDNGGSYYSGEFDIFEKCGLKREVFGAGSNFFYHIKIIDDKQSIIKEFTGGDVSYENDCKVTGKLQSESDSSGKEVKAQHYPECSQKSGLINYYLGGEIKKGTINIVTGSNQKGTVGTVV